MYVNSRFFHPFTLPVSPFQIAWNWCLSLAVTKWRGTAWTGHKSITEIRKNKEDNLSRVHVENMLTPLRNTPGGEAILQPSC